MKLQLFIAFRYLFSKKSHNTINIISLICACGICVATIALVCTLSVYNGFQHLISGLFSAFDPDLRITLVEGKTFDANDPRIAKIRGFDFVEHACEVLEENALVRNKEKQTTVTVKGVSDEFMSISHPESLIEVGSFFLHDDDADYIVLGAALADQIGANLYSNQLLSLYAPKYNTKVNIANPEKSFNERHLFLSGIYATGQFELDSKYAFTDINYARSLFGYNPTDVTAIELNIKNKEITKAQKQISQELGSQFKIQNQEEQHEDFHRMLKIEKWITFLILLFILTIAVFNIIGSLTMLIIEKKENIKTLRNLGATPTFIRQIFLLEGWLITALGNAVGIIIGLVLCAIQQNFGLIKLNSGADDNSFVVDAYPVLIQWTDILLIFISVLLIGFIIAWFPTRHVGETNS